MGPIICRKWAVIHAEYDAAHIPNARFFDIDDVRITDLICRIWCRLLKIHVTYARHGRGGWTPSCCV